MGKILLESALRSIKIFLIFIFTVSVFVAGSSESSTAATVTVKGQSPLRDKDDLMENLLQSSGLYKTAKVMKSNLSLGQVGPSEIPSDQMLIIRNIVNRFYQPEYFLNSIKKSLLRSYETSSAIAMLQWYQSPLGERIVRQNLRYLNRESDEEAKTFNQEIKKYPPSDRRLSLIERLEEALKSSEYSLEVGVAFVRLLMPFNENYRGKSFTSVVRDMKIELEEFAREDALRSLLFIHKDVSDDDLLKYVHLAESKAGQWFFTANYDSSLKVLDSLVGKAERLIARMSEELERNEGESEILREFAPPGQRYIFVKKRDPFKSLIKKGNDVPIEVAEVKFEKPFKRVMDDLKNLSPIPMVVYSKIKTKDPDLFSHLERYASMFKNSDLVNSMSQEEYLENVQTYKNLIDKANENKVSQILTDVQIDYESLFLVGVISKGDQNLALVETRNQKGHSVKIGSLMGPNFGVVEKIDLDKIIIFERSRDYLGNILTRQRKLEFVQEPLEEG